MASQIVKVTKDLTTSADMQKTTQMLMQPYANWEEYLTPAPLSIAIMGELVFISSAKDFSINNSPPIDGFKYIKYPESFRACLMQVCNSGWQAFNMAHKNMDQIRIHTASVPEHMKDAVKILYQGSDEMIEKLLPNELENIRTIANDCVKLADGVEKKYNDVICLIQELLEACTSAKHVYGEDLEKVKNKIKENELREQAVRKLDKRYTEAMETMEKRVKEAHEEYKSSQKNLPQDLAYTVFIFALVNIFNPGKTQPQQSTKDEPSEQDVQNNKEEGPEIYSMSSNIFIQTKEFLEYIDKDKDEINWKELYDQQNEKPKTEDEKEQFERISGEIEKAEKSKTKNKALSLCQRGIEICKQIATYSPEETWDEKKTKELIKDIMKLHEDAQKFKSESEKKRNAGQDKPKGNQSAVQQAIGSQCLRVTENREQLKQAKEEYDKAVEKMVSNQKELTDILVDMQNCNVKKIDFETTIKMLIKGMDAMGRVQEQWQKMVRFFQIVANIVKNILGKNMKQFAQRVEDVVTMSDDSKLLAKDLIYTQALQASNIASLVHMISGTYCEVSNKYLMDRVSSLSRLMSMDKDKQEFEDERQNLQDSCKEAQDNILKLVLSNKREFEKNTEARIKQIESGLKAILPAADPEETNRIQEIVQASITEDTDVNT